MIRDDSASSLSAVKIALAVKRLRAEKDEMRLLAAEPLAVIGMGCRMPAGADSPDAFWQLLKRGTDIVREIPETRWPIAGPAAGNLRQGGYFESVDTFDAEFFGISPREANCIDPQQRMLLEVAWEALADAGIPADALSGTLTGVFVALSNTDYARLQARNISQAGGYPGLGSAGCFGAGHLSYLLDTRGPALVVDTACSSSLVAAHLAGQSLRNRECNVAIVGAANLKLLPDEVIVCSEWGMLSASARCKSFDERADGFVPGEGCGVLVLKRLADAFASGDSIRAVIRGSAVNHDGRTSVITAPSGPAQQAVMRAALESAAVDPSLISFVETHGIGSALGDPIELEALRAVYDDSSSDAAPCLLGAVKTNLGHLEAAAGMASLIKTILALESEEIPANLHFQRLNPRIQLEDSRLKLALESLAWPRGKRARLAAVSAFGLSGTNAHMILEEAPAQPARAALPARDNHLLVLSARSEAALRQLAGRYSTYLASIVDPVQEICANAALHRQHYEYRLAVAGDSAGILAERLGDFAQGADDTGVCHGFVRGSRARELAFLFPGNPSAWFRVGREFVEQDPRALATVKRIDAVYSPLSGWSIADVLLEKDSSRQIEGTAVAEPLLFAIQVALAELLASCGILPDAVAGYGAGEVAAAHVAGSLSLEESVRILHLRSLSLRSDILHAAAEAPDKVAYRAGSIPVISSITGEPLQDERTSAAYWCERIAEPVDVHRALEHLMGKGFATFLEIGPDTMLSRFAADDADSRRLRVEVLPCIREDAAFSETLNYLLARLFTNGRVIDWRGIYRTQPNRVSLPHYPWQRKRYWLDEEPIGPRVARAETSRRLQRMQGELLATLRDLPAADHREVLSRFIKQSIRQVLALDDSVVIGSDRSIQELGMDSLMAVEIRNLLQSATNQALATTIVFERPTVDALAEYLETSLWAARQEDGTQPAITEQEEIRI